MTAMRSLTAAVAAVLAATPALAATGPFFSLGNTDFVVLLAFLLFIAILVYYKVPAMIGRMLDRRADQIRADLNEARALREEAQKLLASYERKQREVSEQAEAIVRHAREEAATAAEFAKADLQAALARRLRAAEDQIASAEAGAVRAVRDRAVQVAIAAAGDAIARSMKPEEAEALISESIRVVEAKLH
jgi:F-type H+-transporting ATPase subunit b